jgi:hypothetical protein
LTRHSRARRRPSTCAGRGSRSSSPCRRRRRPILRGWARRDAGRRRWDAVALTSASTSGAKPTSSKKSAGTTASTSWKRPSR